MSTPITHRPSASIARLLCAASLAAALSACDRTPSRAPAAPPPPSPRAVVERLIDLRTRRDYDAIAPLILPERAGATIDALRAVDEFLDANKSLCDYLREHVGVGLAPLVDQSDFAGNLDIFSPYVELLDERIAADAAEISFTVDGRLPTRRTTLRRAGSSWLYDPGDGDGQALADAFRKMARGLEQVAIDLRSGRLPAEEVRRNPEKLANEVRLRLLPGARLLPRAGAPPE